MNTPHANKILFTLSALYAIALLAILAIWGYTPTNDGDGYVEFAQTCINYGQPYPCTPLIVGQPFIWNIGAINLTALTLWAFASLYPLLVLMCLLKALSAWLVGKVAQQLFHNKAAIIATVLYVLYPNNWAQSTTILSEVPMIAFALTALYWAITRQKAGWLVAAGLMLALANWFRPIAPVFLGTLVLYYLFFTKQARLKHCACLCSGFLLFVATVGLSCQHRTGHFIYQAETLWFNMAEATYEPSVAPQFGTDPYPPGTIRYIDHRERLTAMQCNAIWRERSLQWLKAHPVDYLKKVPGRLMYMYYNDMDNLAAFMPNKTNGQPPYVLLPYRTLLTSLPQLSGVQRLALFNWAYYALLLILAIVGSINLLRTKQWRAAFIPLLIVIGGSLSLVIAVHGETRFKAPFMPFVFMLAAVGALYIIRYKKHTSRRKAS